MDTASARTGPRSAAFAWSRDRWSALTRAAYVRRPDPASPTARHDDLDLVLFGRVDVFRPERHWAPDGTPVDLAWYPAALLDEPEWIAAAGLAAHRLVACDPAWSHDRADDDVPARVRALMPRPDLQAARLDVFMDMARLTVRETGITQDLPSLARFWLQMGHAGLVAALADLRGLGCPNVYTRPGGVLRALGGGLAGRLCDALGLDDDLEVVAEAVQALHGVVARDFARPPWPACMREATRAEYVYTLDAAELHWRLAVAAELAAAGHGPDAVWMLRYWAYALARLPMVFHAATRGEDLAFLRPERAVRPALAAQCPAVLPLLDRALGGPWTAPAGARAVDTALASLQALRQTVDAEIRRRALPVRTAGNAWQPFRAAA